jgi:hypothetical protein
MRKYGDFIVSYSIDDMTVEALQKAASGPYRWRALLDQSATLDQETARILPIQPAISRKWHDGPDDTERNCRLVPGGRFLIERGFEWRERLPRRSGELFVKLWDLGAPGSNAQPICITTKVLARVSSRPCIRPLPALEVVGTKVRAAITYGRFEEEIYAS